MQQINETNTLQAPTYHSTVPAPTAASTQRTGLPPANYAPGFHHLRAYDRDGLSHLNFSINQWSSAYSSPQARHYHNVAARRTNLAMIEEQALMTTLVNQMIFPSFNLSATEPFESATPDIPILESSPLLASITQVSSAPTATAATTTPTQQPLPAPALFSAPEPLSPLEDPDLVGPAAAAVARERRLYISHELRLQRQRDEAEAQALREESKRWDFLLSQMTDWKDREQTWKAFSKKMHGRNKSSTRSVLFRFWK